MTLQTVITFIGEHLSETIAGCALFLTIYQAVSQRRHNRLSVQPHLVTFTHKTRNDKVATVAGQLINKGLGPAFIEKFEMFIDGKRKEAKEALDIIFEGLNGHKSQTELGTQYAMVAGETRDLIVYQFPCSSEEDFKKVLKHFDRLDLRVVYKSGYGKRSTYDSRKEC